MAMKVVMHRYNSICEPDYIRAFSKLGLEVVEDRAEMTRKEIPGDERVGTIAGLILEHRPLFVFSINFFPYISMVCEKLGVLYVAVSVDCPVAEIYDTAVRNSCNRLFLFDRAQYLSVCDENPGGIFHMPLGADAERIAEELENAEDGYDYDISFVGSLYNEKDKYIRLALAPEERERLDGLVAEQRPYPGQQLLEEKLTDGDVEAIMRADPGFYTSEDCVTDIRSFVAVNHYLSYHLTSLDRISMLQSLADGLPDVQVHVFTRSDGTGLRGVRLHGGVNTHGEMPLIFRRSRINLNPTMRSIKTGLPQRIWDVLACGGFLLTNAQEEIPEFLVPGRHLDVYESEVELAEKARYYLQHDEERREIAYAGCEEVRAHHTVLNRVMDMVRIICG